jgi:hypothetical protein
MFRVNSYNADYRNSEDNSHKASFGNIIVKNCYFFYLAQQENIGILRRSKRVSMNNKVVLKKQ